jgi:hypothetical protein
VPQSSYNGKEEEEERKRKERKEKTVCQSPRKKIET